jgi:probable phosphoglycerate mutase
LTERTIFMFRHGETDWNKERRWQGQIDVELNESGRKQANALSEAAMDWRIEGIISSDLSRAADTALVVAQRLGVPLEFDVDLREGNFGKAEGMTKDEIIAKYGLDFLRRWKSLEDRHLDLGFPSGETRREILIRFKHCLDRIFGRVNWQRFALSTHGSILKHFVLSVDPNFVVPAPIPNCSVFEVKFNESTGQFKIVQMHCLPV